MISHRSDDWMWSKTFCRLDLSTEVLAPPLRHSRFDADVLASRRFGAETFWLQDVLAPSIAIFQIYIAKITYIYIYKYIYIIELQMQLHFDKTLRGFLQISKARFCVIIGKFQQHVGVP